MMFKWPKESKQQVEKILASRNTGDENAADLARSLVKLSRDLYGQEDRFIYELLQNANDSAKQGAQVNVAFEVVAGSWLVVSHDGKGFNEADVRGLTSVGLSSDKRENVDAIGYKGIGFKSVFAVSDWVCIQSGDYMFRFDRSAWSAPLTTPWQILPIWTEPAHVPQPVRERLAANASRVAFAVRLRDDFDVVTCLQTLFKNPNILLFLTRVATIEIALPAPCRFERQVSDKEITILRDGKVASRWLTRHFTFDVPAELQQKLTRNEDYPEKLRGATQASITLAASLGADGQPDGKKHPVYTFLPTDVNLELPFVINGNFVLTASRQAAQNSDPWNAFLFEYAGVCTAIWMAELAGTLTFRRTFTRLLPSASIVGGNAHLHGIYIPIFDQAIKNTAVVPTASGKLVPPQKAVLDTLGVFRALGEGALRQFDGLQDAHLIDPGVESPDKLVRLGLVQISAAMLEDVLTSCASAMVDPGACLKVITALHSSVGQNARALGALKDLPWVLDANGTLQVPEDLYLPPADGVLNNELKDFGLSFHILHPALSSNAAAVEWLVALGVKPFGKKEFLRGSVLPAIADDHVNDTNALAIGRFVFECRGSLENDDLVTLRKLPLRVKGGGLKPAAETWLSSEYQPDESLEELIGQTAELSFVDPAYRRPDETTSDWRVFFKQIGVTNTIAIEYYDNFSRSALENEGEIYGNYLAFLDADRYDAIYRPYRYQHVLNHVPYTAIANHLTVPAIARLFWAAVIPVWGKSLFDTDYLVNRRTHTVKVPSFVRYALQNEPIVPTTDGTCRRAKEVYHRSSKLETLIGSEFPLTDFGGVNLTTAQAKEIGLKTELNFFDALTLLSRIAAAPLTDVQRSRLDDIYRWLAKFPLSEYGQQCVRDWAPEAKFLAQDGSFRPAHELCLVFSDKRLNSETPERFLKFHGKPTEFATAADFFALAGVRVIRDDELAIELEDAREEAAPRTAVLQRIPLFALIRANLPEPLEDAIARMNAVITETAFIHCQGCTFRAGDDVRFDLADQAWLAERALHYRGDWLSPLTRYSLMGPLCDLLGLNKRTREVELLLSLSIADGAAWLATQGLDVSSLKPLLAPPTPQPTDVGNSTKGPGIEPPLPPDGPVETPPTGFEAWSPELDWADVHVACAENDFSLTRTDAETSAFSAMLMHMLGSDRSPWAGWIYHVTHLENALAILESGSLLPRAMVAPSDFKDAAGQQLISRTTDDVKQFARFYFRPLTPTQWHNECLGRRYGDIRALCPVPVFFRVSLEDVLRVHGAACAVSNGNLAASASRYGNSASFLEFFDEAHVYRSFGEVNQQTYFRASQQEFLVHNGLQLRSVRFELVCRNEQDRQAVLNQLSPAHGVSREAVRVDSSLFFNDNPAVQLMRTADGLVVKLSTSEAIEHGTMCVRVNRYDARGRHITSTAGRIATVHAGEDLWVHSHGDVIVPDYAGQTLDVTYKEKNREWVIFRGPF